LWFAIFVMLQEVDAAPSEPLGRAAEEVIAQTRALLAKVPRP
jgi:hypothetical protein